MNIGEARSAGLRFYAITDESEIDVTDILNPGMSLGDLGDWANVEGVMLAFRTPRKGVPLRVHNSPVTALQTPRTPRTRKEKP